MLRPLLCIWKITPGTGNWLSVIIYPIWWPMCLHCDRFFSFLYFWRYKPFFPITRVINQWPVPGVFFHVQNCIWAENQKCIFRRTKLVLVLCNCKRKQVLLGAIGAHIGCTDINMEIQTDGQNFHKIDNQKNIMCFTTVFKSQVYLSLSKMSKKEN